eukprot:m51a1_g4935 hypothetical protein (221) ;mRNA; r:286392-287132
MEELTNLTWEAITKDDTHQVYHFVIQRCKSHDANHKEQSFFLPYQVYDINVAVMVDKLRACAGGKGRVWLHDHSTKPLGKFTLAEVPGLVAKFLKLENPKSYTGHGLHATGTTWMADHGASEVELMEVGNWKSIEIAHEYICQSAAAHERHLKLLVEAPSADVAPPPPAKRAKRDPDAPNFDPGTCIKECIMDDKPKFNPGLVTFLHGCTLHNCTINFPK